MYRRRWIVRASIKRSSSELHFPKLRSIVEGLPISRENILLVNMRIQKMYTG
jgi:hypothetical protein